MSKAQEAASRLAKKETEELFIDFDEAVQEQRADAIRIKYAGDVFELPRTVPAWLPLFLNKSDGSDRDNLTLIEGLLGKDFAEKIVTGQDNFVSFQLVNDKILSPVMEKWGIAFSDSTEKNEKTPAS